jgi:LPPG:FO 2-phospho-L-lactate transferase
VTAGTSTSRRVTVLAGGFGGAKLSHGLALASAHGAARGHPPLDLSILVNTGDDLELHGLLVSPDLDTVMYTLAGLANDATGWGVRDESWSASAMLERYGAETWFRLGDRDLGTHIRRSQRLREGVRLTEVTHELAAALGVPARLLPMTDDRVRTEVRTRDGWLAFQDWFVRRHHADDALELRFAGANAAEATPEALEAVERADLVVLAPSNPFVSIGTILAVPGMLDALRSARAPVVAVSPIVGGAALRGPADRMFATLGGEASASGVAGHYATRYPGLVDVLVIDEVDHAHAPMVATLGIEPVIAQTVMRSHDDRRALAEVVLASGATTETRRR